MRAAIRPIRVCRLGSSFPVQHNVRRTLLNGRSFEELSKEIAEKGRSLGAQARERLRDVDMRSIGEFIAREAREAYRELAGGEKRQVLRQQLATNADAAKAEEDEHDNDAGNATHRALMVVEQEEPWEKLRQRLRNAPIIQSILKGAKRLRKTKLGETAAKASESVQEKIEDAREFWETSQNPLVYQASSIVDAVSAETELASAVRWLRKLDPKFQLEEWRLAVSNDLAPRFVQAFAKGDLPTLKPWLSDGLYSRLAHEIRLRRQEGLRYDDARVLDVEHCEILATALDDNDGPPTFVVQLMAQQINCIRNREGQVVEGSPNDIRAYFYVLAFQRHYEQETTSLAWKVIDFQLGGGETYY